MLLKKLCLDATAEALILTHTKGSVKYTDVVRALQNVYPQGKAMKAMKNKDIFVVQTNDGPSGDPQEGQESDDRDLEPVEVMETVAMQIQEDEEYDSEDALDTYESYAVVRKKIQEKKMARGYRSPNQTSWQLTGTVRGKIEAMKARTKCHHCQRVGHWKKECPLRKGKNMGQNSKASASDGKEVHVVDVFDDDYHEVYKIETLTDKSKPEKVKKHDWWEVRDHQAIRHHEKSRKGLFTPHGVKDSPMPMEKMTGKRVTVVKYEDGGQDTVRDDFHVTRNPHMKLKGNWVGETRFELHPDEVEQGAKTSKKVKRHEPSEDDVDAMIASYEEDVLRPVGRGAVSSSFFETLHSEPDVAALSEYAVPDTACRRTLIGEAILRELEGKLQSKGLRVVKRSEPNEFRFGNAGTLRSDTVAQIPVTFGKHRVVVHAAVLPGTGSQTPFLLSKELLKQLNCVLDMQKDECVFKRLGSQSIKLKRTERGHYAIPVLEGLDSQVESKFQKSQQDDEQPGERADGRPRVGPTADPGELCQEPVGHSHRSLRRRRRLSNSRHRDVPSGQIQEQDDDVGSVLAGQELSAVDQDSCGSQEERHRDEAPATLHRVHGYQQKGENQERKTPRIDPAAAHSSQSQSQSTCSRDNIDSPTSRRRRMDRRKAKSESDGMECGRGLGPGELGPDHGGLCGRGHSHSRRHARLRGNEGDQQGQGSRSTFLDEASREMSDEERAILEESLEKLESQKENRKVDVMIITPDDQVSPTMLAEVFSVPRVCKIAESAGISCGGSYDIVTGWDFRKPEKKA